MAFKMPRKEKIYEAYGAISDGRVSMGDGSAQVSSSDRSKVYTVSWEGDVYSSNDNSTYWQGALGYPVIAVLMLGGRLPLDKGTAELFRGVPWKELNEMHRNDYGKVAESVLGVLGSRGADVSAIRAEADAVYEEIGRLGITLKRGRLRPPA